MITPRAMVAGVAAVGIAAGTLAYVASERHGTVLSSNGNEVGGSFRLVSTVEDFVTDADYRGRWLLVYFGDAHCPDEECGRTLTAMNDAAESFGYRAARIVPLFISLDPEHDTADVLHAYGLRFGRRIVPLTGSPAMVKAVAAEYHAPFEERLLPDGTRAMRPSPRIVIMDPHGHYAGTLEATASTQEIADRLTALMKLH
ncbi:electron transport transmembrane protein SenC/PrrC [Ameyamaea chiangmaiensis NBRC 103196]|nr:electron transport transmembrane protein SenC/PrrC [Ameyamaea chiangmaiensis NBRC 103196]